MFTYLAGYTAGAKQVQSDLRRLGWARAKGAVKCRIAWYVETEKRVGMKDPFTIGFVEAMLDAVN